MDIDYMDHVSYDCLVYVAHNNVISWLCRSVASIRTSLLGRTLLWINCNSLYPFSMKEDNTSVRMAIIVQ